MECSIRYCHHRPVRSRGLCAPHYAKAREAEQRPVFLCAECGTQLREPADLCGFCLIEAIEVYA